MEAAAKKLWKFALSGEKERKIVEEVLVKLKKGVSTIAERQKNIQIADQSEYHWQMVEVYKIAGRENEANREVYGAGGTQREAESGCTFQVKEAFPTTHNANSHPTMVLV